MWDFTKVKFVTRKTMRYDSPGDWYGDNIEAWEGMPPLSQQAVQLHEFNESAILRAAGITEEMIDIMDNFKNAAFEFSKYKSRKRDDNGITLLKLAECAVLYFKIPPEIRNLYDEAHVLALQVERAFLEAAGGNWKKHCKLIEDSRGKIPFDGQVVDVEVET